MKVTERDLDHVFRLVVKWRDKWTCQRCGSAFIAGEKSLHCSHFIGRDNRATRFDLDNCDALCASCHATFEPLKATDYRDWKIRRLGWSRFEALVERSRMIMNRRDSEKLALKVALQAELDRLKSSVRF